MRMEQNLPRVWALIAGIAAIMLLVLVACGMASAERFFDKGWQSQIGRTVDRCDYVREGNDYRPERVFVNAGVLVNGVCVIPYQRRSIVPMNSPTIISQPPVDPAPVVCHDEQTTCRCYNYEVVCDNKCYWGHDRGHLKWKCHKVCWSEKTTCRVWNTVRVCK